MMAESLRHRLGDLHGEPDVFVRIHGLLFTVKDLTVEDGKAVIEVKPPPGYCPCGKTTCWRHFMVNGEKE